MRALLAILVLGALGAAGYVFFTAKSASLTLAEPVTAIGQATNVSVVVKAPAGLRSFSAAVEQNGQRQTVFEDQQRSKQINRVFTFVAGQKRAAFLKEGPARLLVEARSNDLRGRKTMLIKDVQVILHPPSVVADGAQHYINQGGAELVTFDVSGQWSTAGVHAGRYTVGSFERAGQPQTSNHRFALFAYPWDLTPDTIPVVYARNLAGTEAKASFWVKVFPKHFHSSTIELKDSDLQKFVNELDPEGSGDLATRFVRINNDMRHRNNEQLYQLRLQTAHCRLWKGAFERLPGKTESFFADQRTYVYKGRKIDQQVHLGFDLAGTMHMPVRAANTGKVVWADRLGIYGNCIVLDHGYTLQTLYGHLSNVKVKQGDTVHKGQTIGISGTTGLALGDHLHFSMLVGGYQVNPVEWWDEHWIHDRILSKISSN